MTAKRDLLDSFLAGGMGNDRAYECMPFVDAAIAEAVANEDPDEVRNHVTDCRTCRTCDWWDGSRIANPDTESDKRPRIMISLLPEECEAIAQGEFASLAAMSGISQIETAYARFARTDHVGCTRGDGVRCNCKRCELLLDEILAKCSGGCDIPCWCPAHTEAHNKGLL